MTFSSANAVRTDHSWSCCSLVETHPSRAFAIFAAIHLFVWTLLPATIFTNPFTDVIEGLIYGHQSQLAYVPQNSLCERVRPLTNWCLKFGRTIDRN